MKIYLKIFLLLILFFGVNISHASQEDVIILDAPSFNRLTVPKANPEIYSRVNQDGEIISDEDYYDDSDYFRPEEDTSRNKAEQKFQKFVDNVIINNKFNNFTSSINCIEFSFCFIYCNYYTCMYYIVSSHQAYITNFWYIISIFKSTFFLKPFCKSTTSIFFWYNSFITILYRRFLLCFQTRFRRAFWQFYRKN